MRIVVLAGDGHSTWMVINALRTEFPNLLVALERPVSRLHMLRNRMRKLGIVIVIGQVLFMLYLPLLKRFSESRIKHLIRSAGLSFERPAGVSVVEFDSVNSGACRAWLNRLNPEVVVVNGTRIISPETLSTCSAVFLNTHCGITPAYRGVHGAYWALAKGDAAHAGVTIHLVDAGIDTGDIVYQEAIKFDSMDNFLTYPVRQYVTAIPLLITAIRDVHSGILKTYRRDDLASTVWYHPTIFQYIYNYFRHGVR